MKKSRSVFTIVATFTLCGAIGVDRARALDQEQGDSLSRFISSSYAAAEKFGAVGEMLKNVGKGDFVGAGTGSFKRDLARGWNDAFDSARGVSQAMGERLSYKITAEAVSDADWATPLGAASAGDVRGTVSGATQIIVGGQATAGGSALFGAIGTSAGFAVGSFFPVVGNVVGAEVGGAIGTVAGGFISSYAYDKFLKDTVGKGVEAGIAALFDSDKLQDAMRAKQAFLHQTVSPEVAAQLEASLSFGSGEAQVLDWERVPYIVTPKQPPASATPSPLAPKQPALDTQQQTALPPAAIGGLLTGVKKIMLEGPTICTIDSGQVSCTQPPANIGPAVRVISRSLSGVVADNILELELRDEYTINECTVTYRGHHQVVLEIGARAHYKLTVAMVVSGCAKPMTRTDNDTRVGTWRVLE